jgi:hypothetical protein
MSVCGEIENIEHEIKQLEEEKTSIIAAKRLIVFAIEKLEKRLESLKRV